MLVKVGFSQGTSWVGRLICWATHTDISHSFFYVEDETGKWVYEAVPRGFRRVAWGEYERDNFVKALIDMDWPHSQVKRALDSMLGMSYPLLTFLVLGLFIMLRRPAHRWATDGVDCVTSVVRVMRQFGIDILDPISPAELKQKLGKK